MHANIVEGPEREPGGWIDSIDISGNVKNSRSGAGGVRHRIVAQLHRDDGIPDGRPVPGDIDTTRHRIGALGLVCRIVPGLETLIPADRYLLIGGETVGIGNGGIVRQQMPVESAVGNLSRVRKGGADERAVNQARKGVSNLETGIRAARATGADGEARNPEGLDEMLLAHHRAFTGDERIAMVGRILERIDEERVASGKIPILKNVHAFRGALGVPTARAAGAMDRDQPLVPALRWGEWSGVRVRGRIEEDRVLIDAAIYRARLDAHDIGNGDASGGRRLRHVGGQHRRVVQRVEHAIGGRHVDIIHPGRRGTIRIDRRTERRAVRKHEGLSLADERLYLWPGDD